MGESRKTSELVRRGKPVNLQKENQWTGSNSVQLEQWQLSLQPSGSCWIQWSVYIPLQLSCSTILPAVDHILYMVIHWEIFDINVSFQPSHNNKEDVEWQGKQLFWMFTPVVECWQAIANQWQLQQHALTEYCHPGFPPVFDIDDLWMPLLKGLIVRHRPTWSARGHVCVCLSADLWFGLPASLLARELPAEVIGWTQNTKQHGSLHESNDLSFFANEMSEQFWAITLSFGCAGKSRVDQLKETQWQTDWRTETRIHPIHHTPKVTELFRLIQAQRKLLAPRA